MSPRAVQPPADTAALLDHHDFADAFAIDINEPDLTAPSAAARVFERVPGWVTRLLALRNAVVRPFGLKPAKAAQHDGDRASIGFFPVLSSTPERIVMGFDDMHLDFRIIVDVARRSDGGSLVTTTTLVKRHNLFGRLYLATVMPFHKMIVPAMLRRVVA